MNTRAGGRPDNQTTGRNGGVVKDDPAKCGFSTSRMIPGLYANDAWRIAGDRKSLRVLYDPSSVKRSSEWVSEWVSAHCSLWPGPKAAFTPRQHIARQHVAWSNMLPATSNMLPGNMLLIAGNMYQLLTDTGGPYNTGCRESSPSTKYWRLVTFALSSPYKYSYLLTYSPRFRIPSVGIAAFEISECFRELSWYANKKSVGSGLGLGLIIII